MKNRPGSWVDKPGWRGCGFSYQYGYKLLKLPGHPSADKRGWVREHIVVAEKALGRKLPSGAVVHHVDGVHDNNSNSNLVICEDQKYHVLLHIRQRVLEAGGNPDLDKICWDCGEVKPKVAFGRNASRGDGLSPQCLECSRKACRSKKR